MNEARWIQTTRPADVAELNRLLNKARRVPILAPKNLRPAEFRGVHFYRESENDEELLGLLGKNRDVIVSVEVCEITGLTRVSTLHNIYKWPAESTISVSHLFNTNRYPWVNLRCCQRDPDCHHARFRAAFAHLNIISAYLDRFGRENGSTARRIESKLKSHLQGLGATPEEICAALQFVETRGTLEGGAKPYSIMAYLCVRIKDVLKKIQRQDREDLEVILALRSIRRLRRAFRVVREIARDFDPTGATEKKINEMEEWAERTPGGVGPTELKKAA